MTTCRLQPDSVEFLINLSEVLELEENRDEAIVTYRTAIRVRPDSADSHNDLAWVMIKTPYCSAQERSEALAHARQAVAVSPTAGGLINTLALAEYRVGHWAETIVAVDRSIALTKGTEVTN
jgi:tetratricopeptide (TPR) repeat protein